MFTPIVLVALPLFLDKGTVLRMGENRGKGIGVITLFTQLPYRKWRTKVRVESGKSVGIATATV